MKAEDSAEPVAVGIKRKRDDESDTTASVLERTKVYSTNYFSGTTPSDGRGLKRAMHEEEKFNPWTHKAYSNKYYDILEKRKELPVWEAYDTLIKLVEENQIIILQGETGSGKTTQVPQFLLESGLAKGK